MKKGILVKDLKAHHGEKITTEFLVLESVKKLKRDGSPYYELLLSDSTGRVAGVMFDDVEDNSNALKRGKVVQVTGVVGDYSGALRIKLLKVEEVRGTKVEEFLEHSPKDIEEMSREFLDLIREKVEDPYIRELLKRIFIDDVKFFNRFKLAPAAKKFHHAYVGGLIEHTLSVVKLALKVCEHYKEVKKDILLAGAFLHDIGKVDEYAFMPSIDKTDEGRLLGHLIMGYQRVNKVIEEMSDFLGGIPKETSLQVLHLILSHHGRLEFGSPTIPQTVEAQILHYIDDMDAKVWMFEQAQGTPREDESNWSKFHTGLERFVYIAEESTVEESLESGLEDTVTEDKKTEGEDKRSQPGLFE